jgi:hypothetical protein
MTARSPTTVFWRQHCLLRRQAIEIQWNQLFPKHDFATMRLRSSSDPIIPWPNEEAWAESARAYHEERRQRERRR